jgi:hypothetical protein
MIVGFLELLLTRLLCEPFDVMTLTGWTFVYNCPKNIPRFVSALHCLMRYRWILNVVFEGERLHVQKMRVSQPNLSAPGACRVGHLYKGIS